MEGRFAAALQDASRQLIIQRLGLLYLFSSYSSPLLFLLWVRPPPLHLFLSSRPLSACLPPRSLQVGFELPTFWSWSCFECKYSLPAHFLFSFLFICSFALSLTFILLFLFLVSVSCRKWFSFFLFFVPAHPDLPLGLFWLVRPKLTPPLFYLKNSWNMYWENCKASNFFLQVWAAVSHPPNLSAAATVLRKITRLNFSTPTVDVWKMKVCRCSVCAEVNSFCETTLTGSDGETVVTVVEPFKARWVRWWWREECSDCVMG